MLRYGSRRIRKQRTISRPRKMKRMRTKTKAALCSSVRKAADAEEDEEDEEKSDSEAEKVLLYRSSAMLGWRMIGWFRRSSSSVQ